MNRKYKYILLILITILVLSGCSKSEKIEYSLFKNKDIQYKFRTYENSLEIYENENWNPFTVKSVTLDYFFPDIDIPDEEYFYNHIEMISEMNANAIKVNELFPPSFYDALYKYNNSNEKPIFLIQSINMDIDNLKENPDPFKLDNMVPYNNKISTYVSAIHGDVTIPIKENDDAVMGGKYTKDVSKYTLSYILGANWDPETINATNKSRTDKTDINSVFFQTTEAKPFEVFIANFLEHTVGYEIDKYKFHVPVSLLNNPKTDTIDQVYNSDANDNKASINPNVITTKQDISYFVSYELFSYEPDFINLNPKYTKFIDHRGNTNNYAGYLNDLIPRHNMPVFVSEFGIPSSRGISKISTSNRNKGKNSEKDQGEILTAMFEDILYQGGIGGSINTWQDNWENQASLDRQNPDNNFGIISFDNDFDFFNASSKDLSKHNEEANFQSEKKDENIIDKIYINNDSKNIYLNIKYKNINNPSELNTILFINTLLDGGSTTNNINEFKTKLPSNFIVNINFSSPIKSKVYINSYYDSFNYRYGVMDQFIETNEEFNVKGNSIFNPIFTLISKPYTDNVSGNTLPLISYETGQLSGDIIDELALIDSKLDYVYIEKEDLLKIKIPWSLLNFTNPSEKEVIGDFRANENIDIKQNIDSLNIGILTYEDIESLHSISPIVDNTVTTSIPYKWDSFDSILIKSRKKDSFDIIKKAFSFN